MLFFAHSGLRYLVFVTAVATIGYALRGVMTGRPYDKRMRVLSSTFAALLDLGILLGFGLLFSGRFYPQLGGHMVAMIFASVVAHVVAVVQRRRAPEDRTYPPHIVGTAVAVVIVIVGIMAIDRPIFG
ncbi:MAG: hypothetical protein OEZ65_05805 [Gemmatimonadota bacterium]|nr:hypothetical protein [Gemmatimonadota bacterium]